MSYKIFDPEVIEPLHQLSRTEAEKHFKLHLHSLDQRIQELEKLTILENIKLDYTLESVEKLDSWFPSVIRENHNLPNEPDGRSFSICNDLAIYFGEILIKKNKNISWQLNTLRKNDISYQRPIITNFKNVKNKNYYIDFDLILCQYAHRIIQNKIEIGRLKRTLEAAIKKL
ncbi:hypothetical protein [Christiangramia sp. SM2212]|uniref:Uncharacterized protein n=1 Tax=Christiangramia sediminicola TaxID=3073267 RepID=A0ABU1ENI9_9FLAO|nr:hypothetical protein [Christiangramia sp. SM2212]MDR5589932.1 hypothetical protein [Christiangramia sp. SM2212]